MRHIRGLAALVCQAVPVTVDTSSCGIQFPVRRYYRQSRGLGLGWLVPVDQGYFATASAGALMVYHFGVATRGDRRGLMPGLYLFARLLSQWPLSIS